MPDFIRSLVGNVYRPCGLQDPLLRHGFEVCRRATRATGEIEYATSLLLPPPLRIATWALYGAVRAVDDLPDTPGASVTDRARLLEEWISAFDADMRDGHSADPVRHALVHTTQTWNLSTAFLYTLFEELRQDVHGREFATWLEWRRYSSLINTPLVLRTASLLIRAAGLPLEPETLAAGAPDMAVAWQTVVDAVYLTDALVDLADDLTRDHVPLPAEALDDAGVRREDLLARQPTPAFEQMVQHLTDRARQWFDQAVLPPVLHPAIGIALTTYRDLYRLRLSTAAKNPGALLHRRPALPWHKHRRLVVPARAKAALAWTLFPFPLRPAPPSAITGPSATNRAESLPEAVRKIGAQGRPVAAPDPHPSGVRPPQLPAEAMPRHVAVIMDGNGRWAAERDLPRSEGHRAGAEAVIDVVHGALEIGLSHLTVYAFSTENWKRPADEVLVLMHEIPACLRRLYEASRPLDVRVRWAGLPGGLPTDVTETLIEAEQVTRNHSGMTLTVCVNYGGRAEITAAAARLLQEAATGSVSPGALSEHTFSRYLHVPELPDVDLLVRTGGDMRTSNFLPWQAAYAELMVLDTRWPDFDRRDLWKAIEQYASRNRRYGSVPRQPHPSATPPAFTSPGSTVACGSHEHQ
ncbi:polyprenyl diphosphate synthase [Streptomyces sp. NPDC007205]|uniref:polyprenyl diphosphate synthase n=1 Tax=Streptomyces sp. NPDC007205 TaxID=3154316 RepID=UPI0033D0D267